MGQSANFPLYCTHCVSASALVAITLAFFLAGHLGTATVAAANIGDSIISAPGISTYAASFAAFTAYIIGPAKCCAAISNITYTLPDKRSSNLLTKNCVEYAIRMLTTSLTNIVWSAILKRMVTSHIIIKCKHVVHGIV